MKTEGEFLEKVKDHFTCQYVKRLKYEGSVTSAWNLTAYSSSVIFPLKMDNKDRMKMLKKLSLHGQLEEMWDSQYKRFYPSPTLFKEIEQEALKQSGLPSNYVLQKEVQRSQKDVDHSAKELRSKRKRLKELKKQLEASNG